MNNYYIVFRLTNGQPVIKCITDDYSYISRHYFGCFGTHVMSMECEEQPTAELALAYV